MAFLLQDPVFLPSSPLFNQDAYDRIGAYYNTSDATNLNVNGLPYAFHARKLKGYEDGFPVMFENKLTALGSQRLLNYVYDGVYLDKNTSGLSVELLAYNAGLHVLSYLRATFSWQLDGSIQARFETFGLPALDYLTSADSYLQAFSKTFANDLWPLWLLCIFFLVFALGEMVGAIKELGRGYMAGEKFSWKRAFMLLSYHCAMEKFDLVLALLMIAGMGVYSAYVAKYGTSFSGKDAYSVYDASGNGPANFLLPPRADILSKKNLGLVNTTGNISSSLLFNLNISVPWSATDPGRWILPQAVDELDDFAQQMSIVHSLSDYYYAYSIIQIVVLNLLILRLLIVMSFQSRVSVITESLAVAAEELIHILCIIVTVIILSAVQAHLLFGNRILPFSNLKDSLYWVSIAYIDRNSTSKTYLNTVQAASNSAVWDDKW
jgi:hypothetical protein